MGFAVDQGGAQRVTMAALKKVCVCLHVDCRERRDGMLLTLWQRFLVGQVDCGGRVIRAITCMGSLLDAAVCKAKHAMNIGS